MSGFDADRPRLSEDDPDERARRSPIEYAKKRVRVPAVLMFVFAILSLAMVSLNVLSYVMLLMNDHVKSGYLAARERQESEQNSRPGDEHD